MKATGIVRRIDDLGRVVIPKEIRRTLRIREGDPLEIYTEKDGSVIFRKYSPMGDLQEVAAQLCDAIAEVSKKGIAVSDRDSIIASAGISKRELLDKSNSDSLEKIISSRKTYQYLGGTAKLPVIADSDKFHVVTAVPIVNQGDLIGSILSLGQEDAQPSCQEDVLLLETCAHFLGRQIEP